MATLTLYPVVDGIIDGDNPTNVNNADSFIATGFLSSPQTNRSLLFFDISSLGSDWTINSATLKLTVQTNFLGSSHNINVYRLKRLWRDGTVNDATWNRYDNGGSLSWGTAGAANTTSDRDGTAAGTLAVTSGTSGQVSITLNTAQIAAWVSGSFENFGLILQADDETNTTLMRFEPTSNGTAANRPQLVIDYTPTSPALTDNILAYHKLDTTGWVDSSGNAHTLTDHGTVTTTTGKLGNAAHFVAASSQYLSNADAALKLGNVDWTWCGWVYLTDNTTSYAVASIGNSTTTGGGFLMYYSQGLDRFAAQLYNDTIAGPVLAQVFAYDAGSPSTGAWHFAALRHDSVRRWVHLFVDNVAPASGSSIAAGQDSAFSYGPYPPSTQENAPTAPTTDYLLANNIANGTYLNGNVDEVGFWSRWLSNAEIAAVKLSIENGISYPFTAAPAGTPAGAHRRGTPGMSGTQQLSGRGW